MVGIPPLGVVVMAGREADSVHVCVCVCLYVHMHGQCWGQRGGQYFGVEN